MRKYKRTMLVLLLMGCFILILSRCMDNVKASPDPRGRMYAGANACRTCHGEIFDGFQKTAHSLATAPASHQNFLADFNSKKVFAFDSLTKLVMEKRDEVYYQVLYKNGLEQAAYKVDIIFGARNAQTFVYWRNEETYELPVSWYTSVQTWGTSPGFPNDVPRFDRLVNADCYDCHSSAFERKASASINEMMKMDSNSLIYGIDCERCHGPGLNHVNYHEVYPEEKAAKYMVKYATLTQGQKLDACAVCHSGNDKKKIQSRFEFNMGDTLDHFFLKNTGRQNNFDVHGNQYGLLAASKCFIVSANMTCGTCHEAHADASTNVAVYSQKCISCHNDPVSHTLCPKQRTIGESIKQNCIDCHMPKQASGAINFQLPGADGMSSYLLRTHKIGVWKKE